MIDFYRCPGGRRFIDATIPDLVLQLKRVADALDRLADGREKAPRAEEPSKPPGGA